MLGQELKNARQALGLSQEAIAERADISRNYLSQLERDLQSPTVATFLRLCVALKVKGSDLISNLEVDGPNPQVHALTEPPS